MDADALGWGEFYVAVAGAAAALAGLIIVAMSVNIKDILSSPSLPARAAAAISALVMAVAACCLGLMPGQPFWLLGVEVLAGTAFLWVLWAIVLREVLRDTQPGRPAIPRFGAAMLSPAAFTVGGVLLVLQDTAGLYWVGAASIVSIIAGVIFAWVALVEILR